MKITFLGQRRPSGAMMVALTALFISLGGVSWAAVMAVPANSVGTKQLRNGAVTARKIAPRAIGAAQINPRAVQARITGTCSPGSALAAVDVNGSVRCNGLRLPTAVGRMDGPGVSLTGSTGVRVASQALARTRAYLALAEPQVTITGPVGEGVQVTCLLAPNHAGSPRSRSLRVELGKSGSLMGAIPLALATPVGNTAVSVRCGDTFTPSSDKAPTVSVHSGVEAIQVNYVP